jgi:hypothetical protein
LTVWFAAGESPAAECCFAQSGLTLSACEPARARRISDQRVKILLRRWCAARGFIGDSEDGSESRLRGRAAGVLVTFSHTRSGRGILPWAVEKKKNFVIAGGSAV